MRLWYDYALIGWFVYVVCLSDAKSCENNVYRAILGKHDGFPGNTMFSQCTLESTRFSCLSCKKWGLHCTRYIYNYIYSINYNVYIVMQHPESHISPANAKRSSTIKPGATWVTEFSGVIAVIMHNYMILCVARLVLFTRWILCFMVGINS